MLRDYWCEMNGINVLWMMIKMALGGLLTPQAAPAPGHVSIPTPPAYVQCASAMPSATVVVVEDGGDHVQIVVPQSD